MPKNGYLKSKNHSFIAAKWLAWESTKTSYQILSANNKGEVKLERCGLQVDGFNPETNTAYEFFGCFYHGCNNCFKVRELTDSPYQRLETINQRYEATLKRIETIRHHGYNLVYIWECEFRQFLKTNPLINERLNNLVANIPAPLDPRCAVFGGRTEVFKLYHKVKETEIIRYLDFTSLYPYINKYSPYPVGHPQIFRYDHMPLLSEILSMHGFIMCSVVAPSNLFLPVLPFKTNLKLYFALCKKCADENRISPCDHNEEEKQITGTWIIPEVALAVKKGYKIKKVFEVWKYDYTVYDPAKKSGGLFTEYVNTFLKIKQEASGWGSKCITDAERDNFIKAYEIKENIILDKNQIHKNIGRRNTAKICLNSLWGKFAQREDRTYTKVLNNFKEFCDFIQSPGIEICSLYPINDETMWVTWKYIQENLNILPHVNIPIAAYTTAFARIKLYEALEKVGKNILYCDTDSLIFVDNKENPLSFTISDFLGDLTDEVECFGTNAFISEFVSTGPKTYGLKVETERGSEYIIKCKGITINFENSKIINFECLKSMVTEESFQDGVCVKNEKKIKRKRPGVVISTLEKKHLSFTFDKRAVTDDYLSYPFGFKRKRS